MISQVEQNYYKDIRRIAKALESIEKHLSTIAKSYEPITYNSADFDAIFNADVKREDDSSVRGMRAKMSCCDDACMIDDGK